MTKLDAALRYLRATRRDEQPGDLLAAEISGRDEDGRFTSVSLHEASALQITEAARAIENQPRCGRQPPAAMKKKAKKLSSRLPEAPKGLGVTEAKRVSLRRGDDGRVAVTFRSVPMDQIEEFLNIVREELINS